MPLDYKRQALLDVFCHCYEKLLDHLDALHDATQADHEWSEYTVVKECVNPATKAFGSRLPESLDLPALCVDFLARIGGSIVTQLGSSSPAVEVFTECQAAAEASPVVPEVDLTCWQRLGEELSRECYQAILPADSPNLTRAVKPVLIKPSDKQKVRCVPRKAAGESEITFYFASDQFTLQSYVNLPFYFFHEYLSHLHTARLFAESDPCPKPFEEGWLLYLAHDLYCHRLLEDPHPALTHPLPRAHYAHQYIQAEQDDATKEPWVPWGWTLADAFERIVGKDLLRRTSLLVASSPCDHFPGLPNLHWDFVKRVQQWMTRLVTRSPREKEVLLERLAALLQGPDPLDKLFDFLIEREFINT
ncbi:MAG: hypothetical protein ACETWR_01880 [Anaerolineae bacterium]